MQLKADAHFAQHLDASDPLNRFRREFLIPERAGKEQVYFLGNSLGLQPRRTKAAMQKVLDQWQHWGVEGFFMGAEPWLQYHDQLVQPLAAVVGALPQELVVMNSLTVNLHLLLVSFYQPKGKRNKILCEAKAFPSDQYLLETHVRQRGLNPEDIIIEVQPRNGETHIRTADILAAINNHRDELALVFWGGVNYYTGQLFDMRAITAAGKAAGSLVGFDLAHAAGNVPLELHRWNVDFASWCSYKYLNSGPGAIGGAYVHERYHHDPNLQRFAGWWGYQKETRFLMQKGFVPITAAEGWQLSTPSPILYAAHQAALDLFAEAGMEAILEKGKSLSDYLLYLLEVTGVLASGKLQVLTPMDAKGCQVSLLIPSTGKAVFQQLTDAGIFADWREPDVIRVAPVPLYNTYSEVWHFCQVLKEALSV
ncbi:Kynureninase [Cnuella takakiae]|uniref:Kynureninase n=2 Tax=Cnuella takakiae TaxID=1302690 RepID=A0A1M5HHT0_9BACT|nr:kynureninase [Cnuella takakiae]OLY92875.1 kynureninase [Cnuella takakiae]SHG15487.1 Kynureninase [Cnuella takakiae]